MKDFNKFLALVSIIFFVAFGRYANAGLTPVFDNLNPAAEADLLVTGGILDTLYGLSNLYQIDDSYDQLWINPDGVATAKAKYAGYTQSFGIYYDQNNDTNPETQKFLFSYASGPLPSTSIPSGPALSPPASKPYLFSFYNDPSGANEWNSIVGRNSDRNDHMVTFLITGGASKGNYVIAWEDFNNLGDKDYNDFVIEVSGVKPVPEPATMLISALTLIGGGAFVRRKFFKQV